jgi:hypothetical protein
LQYLIPCWNEGKTCLKNKQDIIEFCKSVDGLDPLQLRYVQLILHSWRD